jgi:menaquinone-dependent protoporphyrinogen oxidase
VGQVLREKKLKREDINMQNLSRREFLKASGIVVGAAAMACSGSGCTATETPQAAQTEIETPSFEYGKEYDMNGRILVTYATRTGSTVGVASAIAETLSQRGFAVDVKPVKDNPSPAGYQAVLIGSAVNGANWLPEAIEYVRTHQADLKQAPVALFCVHIMNIADDEKSLQKRQAYLKEVRPLLGSAEEAYFAGMGLNPADSSGFERWIYRTFKIGPEGDCRDWNKINGWAKTVEL